MKKIYQLIMSLFFYLLTGFGISLTILANIGVSSFNSLNLSLAFLTSLKVGTVTVAVNTLFLVLYICLTKGTLWQKYLVQGISVVALGQVINFFTYKLFVSILVSTYLMRFILFSCGVMIAGFGTGMVLNLKLLAFPIESVCQNLAMNWDVPFSRLRYGIDLISIGLSLAISFVSQTTFFVREGTLISLVLLSFTISLTKKVFENRTAGKMSNCLKGWYNRRKLPGA